LFSQFAFAEEEIKTTDLHNTEVINDHINEPNQASLSAEDAEALKKNIKKIEENQKKADAFLEELDKEI
jgi:flagellar hook-basal body complex protein FliE